jgi:osmotically-inducible protein OsmY
MNKSLSKYVLTTLAAAAVVATLPACAPLLVGGAVMTGMVVVDRRTSGMQLEDESIELRTAQGIRQNLGDSAHVNVTSYNRQVLLTGEVSTAVDKDKANKVAQSQENVKAVANELTVQAVSSLTQRSKDIIISGQIKAMFVDAKDLQSNAFKVVTESGVVYLMGRVTSREAQRATDIARSIGGVTKVVRVLDIISEEELKRLSAQTTAR